ELIFGFTLRIRVSVVKHKNCHKGLLEMLDHMCGFMNSKQKLANAKDSIEKREIFEDISDHCFEQIDISLDQIRSLQKNKELKKNEDEIIGTKEQRSKRKEWSSKSLRTLRPQTEFFDDIDNSIDTPFKPKLLKKPNSLQKLQSESQLENPYAFEIDQFKYCKRQLKRREPIMYRPLKETAIYWVNTTAQLTEMIDHIVSEFELAGNDKFNGIGVDLRYDNIHSYQGMACVLQISTRSEVYKLRRVLQQLNVIFTNPNIIKVFYQSKQHLLALQRDLGIYV
ncbi:Exonuclease component of the nuclear exosome, partial [Reticulomyxa filosa]